MKKQLFSLLLVLLAAGASKGVFAQGGVEIITMIENETTEYRFLSRFQPAIGDRPNNGTTTLTADPNLPLGWILTYTPDQDFLGSDDMILVSFPIGFNVAFTTFDITVAKADIRARHDFATTMAGAPVTVDVTVNDSVNIGSLRLVSSPVANAGTVAINGDQVIFTPDPDFVGITDLNYVICSDFDVCDLGTVTVNVLPDATTAIPDTVRVFTKKGQPQFIFAPSGAAPEAGPASGEMTTINGVMAYAPAPDFIGDEFLTYTIPGTSSSTVYHVTVLDVEANFFAVEDKVSTVVSSPTTLNVLHNDVYSILADCVSFDAPRFGTLEETGRNGEVVYTPPAGWSGVDQFSYRSMAPGCAGREEVQTVYVEVSNFAPTSGVNKLTTPAGTPVQLTYDTPTGNVVWTVLEGPDSGSIATDPVTGHLNYFPALDAVGQTETVTLNYCLNPDVSGTCRFSQNVTVQVSVIQSDPNACVEEDCVWPGDTNNDGVVDVSDLLPIGQAMGATGTPRLNGNAAGWSAQYSEDWAEEVNGINFKYIDANGDQVISHLDTQVVMQNLGLGHRLQPAHIDFEPFEFSLQGPLTAEPGDLISFELMAGNSDVIVIDLGGFRFPFNYDPLYIDGTSVDISFDDQSWFSYGSPLLSVKSNNPSTGRLDAAITRTSNLPISGYGGVAKVDVIVIDLGGFRGNRNDQGGLEIDAPIVTTVGGGTTATARNGAGHQRAVKINPHQLTITPKAPTDAGAMTPALANRYLDDKLKAFPNPTSGNLTVHLNGQQRFTALQLTDLTGRVLRSEQGLDTNHRELNLTDLPNGLYTLTLTTEAGVVNRKIEVVR